jgi:hypothetical protein
MLISGRCHCGNISFALGWRPEPSETPPREAENEQARLSRRKRHWIADVQFEATN